MDLGAEDGEEEAVAAADGGVKGTTAGENGEGDEAEADEEEEDDA